MKKIIVLLLALTLAVSSLFWLAGCNRDKDNEETEGGGGDDAGSVFPTDGPTFTVQTYKMFDYWIYIPSGAQENMSLLVYLHDSKYNGGDVGDLINDDGFPKYISEGRISTESIVIIPQLPATKSSWIAAKSQLMDLISSVQSTYKTNYYKTALTGHGAGGTAVWEIGINYSYAFYAIAPLNGKVTNSAENVEKLKDMKVICAVGDTIGTEALESNSLFIEELKKINPGADIVYCEEMGHDDVPRIYLDVNANIIGRLEQ